MSKALKTRVIPNSGSLFEVYWEGGGEVPANLSGSYTSQGLAQTAIDLFKAAVTAKVDARQSKPKRRVKKEVEENVSNG